MAAARASFAPAARPLAVVLLLAVVAGPASAVIWNQCDLARALLNTYHIARGQIETWLCIADRESHFNSAAINPISSTAKAYGMFQISNQYWCHSSDSPDPDQNLCNVECDALINNLDSNVACIKIMYAKSGNSWSPWATYPYCEGQDLSHYIAGCGI